MADDQPQPVPRGRPRTLDEEGISVSTWLRPTEADRLIKMANRRGLSLSSFVRTLIVFRTKPE